MIQPYLLIDVSFLAWRAYHSIGYLSHQGVPTGVTFGFLRELLDLQDTHNTNRLLFCFDVGTPLRRKAYPAYKTNRNPLEEEVRKEVHLQIDLLRNEYLPYVGYRNLFGAEGYEADDVIASLCGNTIPPEALTFIVSRDKDLYQCLEQDRVYLWDPTKGAAYSEADFTKEFGLPPSRWAEVLALAGCDGDGVKGIKDVGKKTAAAYLRGKLPHYYKKFQLVWLQGEEMMRINYPLVRLPYKGTPRFKLRPDDFSRVRWAKLLKKLGILSLLRR